MKYWLLTYHAWPVLEYVAIAAGAGRLRCCTGMYLAITVAIIILEYLQL